MVPEKPSMVAPVAGSQPDARSLYERCKELSLAAGATIILGQESAPLVGRAAALVRDCRAAVAAAPGAEAEPLRRCLTAAKAVERLVGAADRDAAVILTETLAVREAHRRMRLAIWELVPCEYVPCGHEAHSDDTAGIA